MLFAAKDTRSLEPDDETSTREAHLGKFRSLERHGLITHCTRSVRTNFR